MSEPTASVARDSRHGISDPHPATAVNNDAMRAQMPELVARFYGGFFAGDVDTIISLLHPDCQVRFPSYPVFRGTEVAQEYFAFQDGVFGELVFELVDVLTQGPVTYVVWREEGVLASGEPWRCHGVDTIECADGCIRRVDVGGSAWPLLEILPRFQSAHEGAVA